MGMENSGEILCLPGEIKNYAVEFTYIKEIKSEVKISKIPCLPEHFVGVFQYRGSIVPIIELEASENSVPYDGTAVVLVIEYQKYQLGILISKEPYMIKRDEMTLIEMPEEKPTGIWIEKAFYKNEEHLFAVADIPQMMDYLLICRVS